MSGKTYVLCPNAAPRVLITGEKTLGSLYLSGCGCKMRGAAWLVSIITSSTAAAARAMGSARIIFTMSGAHLCAARRLESDERLFLGVHDADRLPWCSKPKSRPYPCCFAVVTAVTETTILERRRSPARGDPCNLFLSAWDARNHVDATRTWGNRSRTIRRAHSNSQLFDTEFRAGKLLVGREPHVNNFWRPVLKIFSVAHKGYNCTYLKSAIY